MKNVLLFSDLHLTQKDIVECKTVLDEISEIIRLHNIDTVVDLGDTFDNLKPSSIELDVFASFVKKINLPIYIIAAKSHESTSETDSIVNHFGILADNVKVFNEYKDESHLYCGHFIVKEAKKSFGATISKTALKQYKFVFLGHQHQPEIINPNVCQLGSARYINFDEVNDKQKHVAILTNYKEASERVFFIPIKSAILMRCIELKQNNSSSTDNNTDKETTSAQFSVSQAQREAKKTFSCTEAQKFLDSLSSTTKVKVKLLDFESFKQFLPLVKRYTEKFYIFKYETDFALVSVNNQKCKLNATSSLKEELEAWLTKQKIDKEIRDILLKEVK